DAFRGTTTETTTDLQALMSHLSMRFDRRMVQVVTPPSDIRVTGDEVLLTRALRLVIDHAVRYRGPGSPVWFRAALDSAAKPASEVGLALEAATPGFNRSTWHYLIHDELDADLVGRSGMMRLQTASHIVRMSGGSVAVDGDDGHVRVLIKLGLA
ncbi:MAG: hypothetical protein ABI665_28330, partial [Vicinamibacterales bacterium]